MVTKIKKKKQGVHHTREYLANIGVPDIVPRTCPFDPGYDPATTESHLDQSAHLMSSIKISMACWLIADEDATRRKFAAAKKRGVSAVTGGGPFEIAVAQNRVEEYFDLCADIGASRVECGAGFTDMNMNPRDTVRMASARALEVQFELGKKHSGLFDDQTINELIVQGREWLDAGAVQIIVEGRENARDVGLFGQTGQLNRDYADRFVQEFGFADIAFEAPSKLSQFALLNHFGRDVELCNVRLEELLRVEIYRYGLHSDAFRVDKLRPAKPEPDA